MAHRTPAVFVLPLCLLSFTTALLAQPPQANDAGFSPLDLPSLEISRAPGPIVLDGDLDDPGWVGAARARGFSETFPTERGRPPVDSEVWVTYDDENLYLGFFAFDDPRSIRTSIRDRDEIWEDDYFGIMLDTYGDATWAYYLFANPAGVQGDSRFATAGGEDDGFDIVYHTEARTTDRGYRIEMAIPFESLRFPNRPVQRWRATFWRTRPRASRSTYSWAAMDRDVECFLCQFGTLTGIEGVKPGGALEILPALVASHSSQLTDPDDPESGLDETDGDGDIALGIRYAHASGITAEGTLNPDFSQVESDVDQIDVNTTFALFLPERRPFFQEGSDLFDTFFDVVYTRQINDPDVAAKTIGRLERSSFAYLGARDAKSPLLLPFQERSFVGSAGESISNILRFRQTYSESSYFGAVMTDRRFESGGGSGTTYGIDGVHRFLDKYRFEYQLLGSHTIEPDEAGESASLEDLTFDDGRYSGRFDGESFAGFAQYTSFERSARFWSFDFDYWASSPTFRADNGFEFRNDFRRFSAFHEFNWYPENTILDRFTPDLRFVRVWDYDGTRKENLVQPTLEFTFKRQTFVEVGYEWESERFRTIEFDDLRRWFVFVNSDFSDPLQMGVWFRRGDEIARNVETPFVGTGTELSVWATFKPFPRLTVEPEVDFEKLERSSGEEVFSGYIVRTKTTYNFSRRLFLRLVTQYNDFSEQLDFEPLLTYKINPFTLFFVGSTQQFREFDDPSELVQTSRQLFLKFQYLFRM